jgi:hypothetical protein
MGCNEKEVVGVLRGRRALVGASIQIRMLKHRWPFE